MEFLALLVPHVLLRYQVVIRSYGAVSTTIRRQLGWIGKESGERQPPARALLEEEESGFVKVRRRSWARLIKKVWMEDPEVCWRCGERMEDLAAISSPAQDAVIEKVLRTRVPQNQERRCVPRQMSAGQGPARTRLPVPPGAPGDETSYR